MGKSRILIVDDKLVNIQILSRYLKKYDFKIKTAMSGAEALELVENYTPDVVLMDICMPEMDGIECVEKMKEAFQNNFFVIFITALKDSETRKRAFEVGATSFLNKPVDLKFLKETIDRCLNTSDSAAVSDEVEKGSDRKQEIDSSILHSNKMNNLGQLSSGVAHDINNFLGGILGNVSLIELSTDDSEILNCCREIKKAVNSTSELTEAMTAYSKKEPADRKLVNLSESLIDAINLIERDARYYAEVVTDIRDEEVLVEGVYSELTNIFLNILKNAYQAVGNDGQISISLKKVKVKKTKKVFKDLLTPGDYALVVIKDNGKGISQEIINHIFEPFFTTKADGTGLGLSSAYKYLRKNSGALEVKSKVGEGTEVELYFTVCGQGKTRTGLEIMKSNVSINLKGVRIVLMDDDVIFCNSLSGFLKKHNASVVSFTDRSFIDFLDVNPFLEGYDILIIDYQSPFFNSVELIEEVAGKNRNISSYIVSGSNVDVSDIVRCGFFRKPLSFVKLAEKLIEDRTGN